MHTSRTAGSVHTIEGEGWVGNEANWLHALSKAGFTRQPRDSPGIYRSPLNQGEGAAVAGSWKGWGERAPPYRGHQYYIRYRK